MEYSEKSSFTAFNGMIIQVLSDSPEYYALSVSYSPTGEILGSDTLIYDREVIIYEPGDNKN